MRFLATYPTIVKILYHGWRAFQPIDRGRSEPHSLLYVTVVKMNASRYYNYICS